MKRRKPTDPREAEGAYDRLVQQFQKQAEREIDSPRQAAVGLFGVRGIS